MQKPTFFFYDLETSGLSSSDARIMQFAGQRTDLDFQPLGEPVNILVRLDDDTLPSPGAILTTGITPQKTQAEGIPEKELADFLVRSVFTPDTTILGYNSVRFDDKFIQHLFWRNFYPAYDWQWREGRSRWDMLDVVRMTRALRPDGITWPFTSDNKPTNRLEILTKANGISHESAHDALSDVNALIDVTRLVNKAQPRLFSYLYRLRNKAEIHSLVDLKHPTPFVYTSGRYGSKHLFTTVAYPVAPGKNGGLLVFDLRYNLDHLLELSQALYPAFKDFAYNRCPAVAPLSVLEQESQSDHQTAWERIHLNRELIDKNLASLLAHPEIIEIVVKEESNKTFEWTPPDVESALYDTFLPEEDTPRLTAVRSMTSADELADFHPNFRDDRLSDLLLHYKAKNFPSALSESEQNSWNTYRSARLERQSAEFLKELELFSKQPAIMNNPEKSYLITELQLYYQSLQNYDL